MTRDLRRVDGRADTRPSTQQPEPLTGGSIAVPGARRITGAGDLTPSEAEVASLVGLGLSNRRIAKQNGLTVKTVEAYLARVLVKSGCRSRSELAVLVGDGWLDARILTSPDVRRTAENLGGCNGHRHVYDLRRGVRKR